MIDKTVTLFAESKIPLPQGEFTFRVFRTESGVEHVVVSQGTFPPDDQHPVFVRIHSECLTGEAFGSLRCDCQRQLLLALETIAGRGEGIVVYLRSQEGRGIGLGNKIRAYALQDTGCDTVEANERLGFDSDLRDFSIAAKMLKALGVTHVELNTNNPQKIAEVEEQGLVVTLRLPSLVPSNPHNRRYLETKAKRMGHKM
jgi:GTP cyclohydrolase II